MGEGFQLNTSQPLLRFHDKVVKLTEFQYRLLQEVIIADDRVADIQYLAGLPSAPSNGNVGFIVFNLNDLIQMISGQRPLVPSKIRGTVLFKGYQKTFIDYGDFRFNPNSKDLMAYSPSAGEYITLTYSWKGAQIFENLLGGNQSTVAMTVLHQAAMNSYRGQRAGDHGTFSKNMITTIKKFNNEYREVTGSELNLIYHADGMIWLREQP